MRSFCSARWLVNWAVAPTQPLCRIIPPLEPKIFLIGNKKVPTELCLFFASFSILWCYFLWEKTVFPVSAKGVSYALIPASAYFF